MKMNVNPQEKHTMLRNRTGSGSEHSDHRRPLRFISVLFFSSESRSFLLRRGPGASSSTWGAFGSAGVSNTSSVTSCVITSCSSLRFSFWISFTICLSFCLAAVASRIIRRCWTNIKHKTQRQCKEKHVQKPWGVPEQELLPCWATGNEGFHTVWVHQSCPEIFWWDSRQSEGRSPPETRLLQWSGNDIRTKSLPNKSFISTAL